MVSRAAAAAAGIAVAAGVGFGIWYFFLRKPGSTIGGFNVSVVSPSISQGSYETITGSGATPYGAVAATILTNNGLSLGLLPDAVVHADGTYALTFIIGTNVPLGANTIQVRDVSSGATASAQFTVV